MALELETPPLEFALATTAELVLAAQGGDNDAFGELVSRFERMVQAVCYQRLRNHAEAQEAAQEVFIKALQKLEQLQEPAAFAGWLRAIAARQAINRSLRRPPAVSIEPHALESVGAARGEGPLGSLLARERVDQLHEGLDRLAKLDRNTLVAFYIEGQSLIEMSDEFAAPIGTIKRRLHVARKRLAKELECLQAV
jgi:RNA polymerase sigma-70 factor (ECF subfamily)